MPVSSSTFIPESTYNVCLVGCSNECSCSELLDQNNNRNTKNKPLLVLYHCDYFASDRTALVSVTAAMDMSEMNIKLNRSAALVNSLLAAIKSSVEGIPLDPAESQCEASEVEKIPQWTGEILKRLLTGQQPPSDSSPAVGRGLKKNPADLHSTPLSLTTPGNRLTQVLDRFPDDQPVGLAFGTAQTRADSQRRLPDPKKGRADNTLVQRYAHRNGLSWPDAQGATLRDQLAVQRGKLRRSRKELEGQVERREKLSLQVAILLTSTRPSVNNPQTHPTSPPSAHRRRMALVESDEESEQSQQPSSSYCTFSRY